MIKVVVASEVGRRGILIQDYQCLLRDYSLVSLDINSVSRTKLINVFASQFKRIVERSRPKYGAVVVWCVCCVFAYVPSME